MRKFTVIVYLYLGFDFIVKLKSFQAKYNIRRKSFNCLAFHSLHLFVTALAVILVVPI